MLFSSPYLMNKLAGVCGRVLKYIGVSVNESGPNSTVAHEGDSSLIQSRSMTEVCLLQ